ncbi:hypothetical protein ABPG74_006219 [Tetrahymena malaccensis]
MNNSYQNGFLCNLCNSRSDNHEMSWNCNDFHYDICDKCSTSDKIKQSAKYKFQIHNHQLKKTTAQERNQISSSYQYGFYCNFCNQLNETDEVNWMCPECLFDLCLECSNSKFISLNKQ